MKIQELNSYVIVFNNDKVLVLKRYNELWEFPGGGIEWGEEPEEAAVRETREETGLKVEGVRLIGVTSATFKKGNDDKHAIYVVYRAEAVGNKVEDGGLKVEISGEHLEYRWITVNELKYLKLGLNAEKALDLI